MIGARVYGKEPHLLEAGEYCFDAADGRWYVCPPDGDVCAISAPPWSITEHEDGTITVSPSIRRFAHGALDDAGNRIEIPEWHGYLERGVWRTV